jgi:hypothetical protein
MTSPQPVARTTDSAGREITGRIRSGTDWWEKAGHGAAPDQWFPSEVTALIDEGKAGCPDKAPDHMFPWWCTRLAGHPMPHRASIGDDPERGDLVRAEWGIPS